jgi:hypothetical protein
VLRSDRPARLAVAVLATAAALLLVSAVPAAKLKPQNLTQLIAESQVIVAGKVTRVADDITPTGLPYTEITLAVSDCAKGGLRSGTSYKFRQFGLVAPRRMPNGKLLLAVSPDGFPRWQEGELVIAFLQAAASKTGLQTTVGLAQGKLSLLDGRAVNELDNRGLFDGVRIDATLLRAEERAMLASKGPVDAATFARLVDRAVRENWIAAGKMR